MWSPWKCEITTMSTAFGIEARGHHVAGELADIALAGGERAGAVAGVDHHQLAAGVDHQRREMDRHLVLRQEGLLERGVDLVLLGVEHEACRPAGRC